MTLIFAAAIVSGAPAQTTQATQPVANEIHRTTTVGSSATSGSSSQAPGGDTARIIGALAAVLALIFVLRAAIKRMAPAALNRGSRGIRVVGQTYIGSKQRILLLQIGRRILVVGDAGQQLQTLCEITDPDEIAALLGEAQSVNASEVFRSIAAAPPMKSEPSDPVIESARNELNGLTDRVRILSKHLNRA